MLDLLLRPFMPATGIQIPLGTPNDYNGFRDAQLMRGVTHMDNNFEIMLNPEKLVTCSTLMVMGTARHGRTGRGEYLYKMLWVETYY